MLWRDALTGRSMKRLGGAAVGWVSGGVLWRMLWRGALLHKRSLRKGLEQEASKRPARGQREASKRPAQSQQEASKRPARGQQEASKKPEASKRPARGQQEASKRLARGQQGASKKPARRQRPARGQEEAPNEGTPRNTETIEKQPFS